MGLLKVIADRQTAEGILPRQFLLTPGLEVSGSYKSLLNVLVYKKRSSNSLEENGL
jgi:hypothetical protein